MKVLTSSGPFVGNCAPVGTSLGLGVYTDPKTVYCVRYTRVRDELSTDLMYGT